MSDGFPGKDPDAVPPADAPDFLPEGCHAFELVGSQCEWNLIDVAGGEFDRNRVNVRVDMGLPTAWTIPSVPDPSVCDDAGDGWFWVDYARSDIKLCPSTCTAGVAGPGSTLWIEVAVPPRGCPPDPS